MKTLIQIISIALIASRVTPKVEVAKQLPDAVILDSSLTSYTFNISEAFNTSQANGRVEVSTNLGRLTGPAALQTVGFTQYNFETLYQVTHVESTITAYVYDKYKIVLEFLDHDGRHLRASTFVDIKAASSHPKAEYICTGFAFNPERAYLYIGCYEEPSEESLINLMTIFTFDVTNLEVVGEEYVLQLDGLEIKNKLRIFLAKAPQSTVDSKNGLEAAEITYLVAYDEIPSEQVENDQGTKFRVYRNVEYRKLRYYYTGTTVFTDSPFQAIYGIFPYSNSDNQLLVSGRIEQQTENIQVFACILDNNVEKIVCRDPKNIGISNGYIALQDTSILAAVDTDLNTITVWSIPYDWTDPNWGNKILQQRNNINLFIPTVSSRTYISGISYSKGGAVIQYNSKVHREFGSVVIDWYKNSSTPRTGDIGFAYLDSFVLGNVDVGTINVYAFGSVSVWVVSADLQMGANNLTLTAKDDDGSVTNTATLNKTQWADVKVKLQNPRVFRIHDDQNSTFKLRQEIASGNALTTIEATSSSPILKIQNQWIQREVQVKIDEVDLPVGEVIFADYMVAIEYDGKNNENLAATFTAKRDHKEALTQTPGNRRFVKVGFFNRTDIKPDGVVLNFKSYPNDTFEISQGASLSREVSPIGNFRFVFFTRDFAINQTVFYLTNLKGVTRHFVDGYVLDAKAEKGAKKNNSTKYLNIILAFRDRVDVWRVDPDDYTQWIKINSLNANSFGVQRFCPKDIRVKYVEIEDDDDDESSTARSASDYLSGDEKGGFNSLVRLDRFFAILSVCERSELVPRESSVFFTEIDGTPNQNFLPLTSESTPRVACHFETEILVGADDLVYGTGLVNNFKYWTVPLGVLNIDRDNFNTHCVDRAGSAVVYGKNPQSVADDAWTLAVIRSDQLGHQDRRYPVILNFNAQRLENYPLNLTTMTVLYDAEGGVKFHQSDIYPNVEYETAKVAQPTNVTVSMKVSNANSSDTINLTVTVDPNAPPEVHEDVSVEEEESNQGGLKRLFSRLF